MEASSLEESDLKGMEVCNFRGTEVALPLELIEQVSSFHVSATERIKTLTPRQTRNPQSKATKTFRAKKIVESILQGNAGTGEWNRSSRK